VHHHPTAAVPIPAPWVANGRRCIPTINTFANLRCGSPPLTFADALVFAIRPPPGFEALSTAIAVRCAITIIYDRGASRPGPRTMTPRQVLEVNGVAYVVAHCHQGGCKKTFRLDRSREHWLDEKGTSRLSEGREAPDV